MASCHDHRDKGAAQRTKIRIQNQRRQISSGNTAASTQLWPSLTCCGECKTLEHEILVKYNDLAGKLFMAGAARQTTTSVTPAPSEFVSISKRRISALGIPGRDGCPPRRCHAQLPAWKRPTGTPRRFNPSWASARKAWGRTASSSPIKRTGGLPFTSVSRRSRRSTCRNIPNAAGGLARRNPTQRDIMVPTETHQGHPGFIEAEGRQQFIDKSIEDRTRGPNPRNRSSWEWSRNENH